MGTRAVIEFKDVQGTFAVYQHWDGDPETIKANIQAAKKFAWPLPRFEACEFAAAYIAATKRNDRDGGGIYFSKGAKYHGDLSYSYVVTLKNDKLHITVKSY